MIIFNNRHSSVIHRIDPRFRLAASAAFAVIVVLSSRPQSLAAALAVALGLAAAARLSLRQVLARLGELNVFIFMLAVFMPIATPGEEVFSIGGLVWTKEGLGHALVIGMRANAVMVALVALLTTMEPAHLGLALHQVGCPEKIAHVLLFMVRYVEVIHREYHRLRDAMRLRAFKPSFSRHTLRTFGYLVGQLLVRSFDRSERILEAMKCRGYRGRFYVLERFTVSAGDFLFTAAAAVVLAGLGLLEWA